MDTSAAVAVALVSSALGGVVGALVAARSTLLSTKMSFGHQRTSAVDERIIEVADDFARAAAAGIAAVVAKIAESPMGSAPELSAIDPLLGAISTSVARIELMYGHDSLPSGYANAAQSDLWKARAALQNSNIQSAHLNTLAAKHALESFTWHARQAALPDRLTSIERRSKQREERSKDSRNDLSGARFCPRCRSAMHYMWIDVADLIADARRRKPAEVSQEEFDAWAADLPPFRGHWICTACNTRFFVEPEERFHATLPAGEALDNDEWEGLPPVFRDHYLAH